VGGGQTGEKSGTVRDPHLFFEIGTRDRRRLLPAAAVIYFSGFEHEAQRGATLIYFSRLEPEIAVGCCRPLPSFIFQVSNMGHSAALGQLFSSSAADCGRPGSSPKALF
jgi:hypothetical protein